MYKARETFCFSPWRFDNEQWALHLLADLSNEPFEKVCCGYKDRTCVRCADRICIKEADDSWDISKYRARICDEICAKALEAIR